MPIYEFLCNEDECKHEWEVHQSMSAPNPEECPKCHSKEKIKKLISLGSKGIVELYGNELVAKVKEDAKKLKQDAAKDEKLYSNLLGETRYEQLQTKMDQQKTIRRSK
jgi:putative FmdB family regulatory protein